jgi:ATP-binding protein involved in chromosome partitioning
MVMGALQQMLSEVDWGELDIMVIDMSPGTGNAQLTMAQPVPPALTKASTCSRRSPRRFSASSRTWAISCACPCADRSEIFSHHGARQKAERLGTELHGEVLLELKARETSDGRSPITVSEPDNPQVLVFRHIAGRICEKVSAHAEQRATRIVIH